ENAEVYYFENDPETETDRAQVMEAVARDTTVAVTAEHLRQNDASRERRAAASQGVHPFEEPGCQPVHFFNGLEIVYDWCQRVMGQSMQKEDLLRRASAELGGGLLEVRFPSADEGFQTVSLAEVDQYWGQVRVEDVVEPGRCRNLSRADKEHRRALFVAAVKLRSVGYVDGRNEPSAVQLLRAKRNFVASQRLARLSVGKSFARKPPEVKAGNYMQALHELVQQRWGGVGVGSLKDVLKYTSWAVPGAGGFSASVSVAPLGKAFEGDSQPSKKAAEQSAAQKAYNNVVAQSDSLF
ncbi:unnamed protein product, partial [Polarella glacialis]